MVCRPIRSNGRVKKDWVRARDGFGENKYTANEGLGFEHNLLIIRELCQKNCARARKNNPFTPNPSSAPAYQPPIGRHPSVPSPTFRHFYQNKTKPSPAPSPPTPLSPAPSPPAPPQRPLPRRNIPDHPNVHEDCPFFNMNPSISTMPAPHHFCATRK